MQCRHALLASSLELPQARGGSFGFFPGVVGPDELVAPTDAPIIGDVFDSDAFAPGVHFCFFCSVRGYRTDRRPWCAMSDFIDFFQRG